MKKTCPGCQTPLDLDDALQGEQTICTSCQHAFIVPVILQRAEEESTSIRLPGIGRVALPPKNILVIAGVVVLVLLLFALVINTPGGRDVPEIASQSEQQQILSPRHETRSSVPDRSTSNRNRSSSTTPQRSSYRQLIPEQRAGVSKEPRPTPEPSVQPPHRQRSDRPTNDRNRPVVGAKSRLNQSHATDDSSSSEPDRRRVSQRTIPDRSVPAPNPTDNTVSWQDGFEDGWKPYWKENYLYPEQAHGQIYLTNGHVHSGRSAVVLEQAPGQHATALEHVFPDGFQGRLSVWMRLRDREVSPDVRRDTREGSHTCFKVDDGSSEYMVIQAIKPTDIEITSRAKQPGKFDHIKIDPRVSREDWHQYTIEISPDGARGFVDSQPLQAHHPTLTRCRRVRLEIGWSCGGIAVWDDFEAM